MTAQAQRTVLTYGTFDLFHPGHVQLLRRARSLGTRLVVGLSTDEFNALKGKQSVMSFEDRKSVLEACRYVDEVFLEESLERKREYIERYRADILVMGDDWQGKFDGFSDICKVVYLPRTPSISTTSIIEVVKSSPGP